MPRETKAYREILAQLNAAFPGRGAISLDEAASYYGCSKRTLQRDATFPVGAHNKVVLVNFARWMSAG